VNETPPAGQPGDGPEEQPDTWFHPAAPQERARPEPEPAPEPVTEAPTEPVVVGPPTPPAPPPPEPAQPFGAVGSVIRNWPAAVVLALFALSAVIVPTMTQIATTDDWGYTRSVEILLDEGELKVFPVVAATAVGQILWGALFGAVFGMSLGMMRISTVVMVALGGIALYAILRQLGVSRSRAALGMAVWLFNPLTYALAFSFMTDAHFASAMLISVAFYLRGLRPDREDLRYVVAGSFLAGFAFLIRQQGALIPLAVGVYLVASGRLWIRMADLRRLLAVALVPALMLVGYYVWLEWFNDVPDVQEAFIDEVREAGWEGTWVLVRRIPVYVLFYAGLLLLPLLVGVVPWLRKVRDGAVFRSPVTWYGFLAWAAVVAGGLYFAGRRGQVMPFAPQWVGLGGLGPPDVLGARPRLVERDSDITYALTIAAAVGAIVLGLVVCRRLVAEPSPERAGFWLVMTVGIWQLAGILPPSYHYLRRGVTLDRYLLPVIAILIVVALWALRDVDLFQPVAWTALAAVAVFSVAAERDYLVFMDAVWDMAEHANENGVENDRLDAGSGWDGYHLYTVMLDENITKARSPRGSPWWIYFYAKPTDSSYIVATDTRVRRGYVVVESREYDQWLNDDPTSVYLLARWGLPFPVGEGTRATITWPPFNVPPPTGRPPATPPAPPATPGTPQATPAAAATPA
jgi:hypothetical protein